MGKLEGFIAMQLDLVGEDELGVLHVFGSQELLGACTRCSTFAVVIPIDGLAHERLQLVEGLRGA